MRRTLLALSLVLAALFLAPAVAGAQDDGTTTMPSIPLEQDDTATTAADASDTTDTTDPADADPDELAVTGSRDTLATLGVGFLLLGVGCITLGAARRMLVAESHRHS